MTAAETYKEHNAISTDNSQPPAEGDGCRCAVCKAFVAAQTPAPAPAA